MSILSKFSRQFGSLWGRQYRPLGVLAGVGLATATLAHALPAAPPDGDDPAVLRQLVLGLQNFYRTVRPEKAYLHLDKATYAAGETIWLKAYVADAMLHHPDSLSKVLYVELLTAKRVVSRRTLQLVAGRGHGTLALPDTLRPGTYLLRAYTNWMRNASPTFFYQRQVQVWPGPAAAEAATPASRPAGRTAPPTRATAAASRPPDVQFFPEGGSLVEGLESTVAFKAVGADGLGLAVSGQVLDAQNQPVATFSSHHRGMGTFRLLPQPGQRYHAQVVAGAGAPLAVALPAAQPSGYLLRVATGANAFFVSIQQRGAGGPLLLVGQVRGTPSYVGRTQVTSSAPVVVRIPKSQFSAGIVHFTLLTTQGVPLAERLAFDDRPASLRVTLSPDQASYGPRQPVRLRVAVADSAGRPLATDLSLAITVAGSRSALAETIASSLLLTSDLLGYVEEPGYYFQNPGPETTQALDELLLTQGWRRFVWKDIIANKLPVLNYGAERSLGLLGQVTTTAGQPAPGARLTLLQTAPITQSLAGAADAEGRFLFNGLGDCDTSRFTMQARPAKGNSGRNLVVHLDAGPSLVAGPLPGLPAAPTPAEAAAVRSSQQQALASRQLRLDTTNTILLNNVAVTGRRADMTTPVPRLYSAAHATVVQIDKIVGASAATSVFQLLQGRVAGVQITGIAPNERVLIRGVSSISGTSQPLFLLDGVPTDISTISNVPVNDISTVEILKGAEAAIFGSRAGGGVLAVYTHRGDPNYRPPASAPTPGTLQAVLPGYECSREFYQPHYDRPARSPRKPDPRHATLYWNPAVRTNASGQAELLFYTADETGSFDIHAEGLSPNGLPLLGDGKLEIK